VPAASSLKSCCTRATCVREELQTSSAHSLNDLHTALFTLRHFCARAPALWRAYCSFTRIVGTLDAHLHQRLHLTQAEPDGTHEPETTLVCRRARSHQGQACRWPPNGRPALTAPARAGHSVRGSGRRNGYQVKQRNSENG
jgi:hypothetical protein